MVVILLAEQSPPTPEVDSSYPFVGNFFIQNLHLLPTVDTKTKEKRGLVLSLQARKTQDDYAPQTSCRKRKRKAKRKARESDRKPATLTTGLQTRSNARTHAFGG